MAVWLEGAMNWRFTEAEVMTFYMIVTNGLEGDTRFVGDTAGDVELIRGLLLGAGGCDPSPPPPDAPLYCPGDECYSQGGVFAFVDPRPNNGAPSPPFPPKFIRSALLWPGATQQRAGSRPMKPLHELTDDDHVRNMLDGADHGLLDRLGETDDAWSLGEVQLAKRLPFFRFGGPPPAECEFASLNTFCRFEALSFALDQRARGFAVWLQTGPRNERSLSLHNRGLCGWVRADREVDVKRWIWSLNDVIEALLVKQQASLEGLTREAHSELLTASLREARVLFGDVNGPGQRR